MGLKEQMAADVAVFLNTAEFADSASYNGLPINVVAEIGPDKQSGNTFADDAQTDRAIFWVSATAVPNPAIEDRIEHNGKLWRVMRILESGGGMHKLECIANEAVRW